MNHMAIAILLIFSATQAWAANAVNFHVELSGAQEVPPVETATSGTANLHVNRALSEITFKLDIRNAEGMMAVAGVHLHCAPAGVNGGVVVFLAGPFAPGYDGDVQLRATLTDASIINPACGATIAELVDSMLDGNVYINAHSLANPGGEIRGQIN